MKSLFLAVAMMFVGLTASAQPAWLCGMAFKGESKGAQILIGRFHTEAQGRLKCVGLDGKTYSRNVNISMGNSPLAPAVGIGHIKFVGRSAQISLFNCGPEALFGSYVIAKGQGSILGGAGAFVATKLAPPQVAVEIALQLTHGFGIELGVHRMIITPAR